MNATSSPAVSRPASTSVPPNQKMATSDERNSTPMLDQKVVETSTRWRAVSNKSSTASR